MKKKNKRVITNMNLEKFINDEPFMNKVDDETYEYSLGKSDSQITESVRLICQMSLLKATKSI